MTYSPRASCIISEHLLSLDPTGVARGVEGCDTAHLLISLLQEELKDAVARDPVLDAHREAGMQPILSPPAPLETMALVSSAKRWHYLWRH